MLRKVRNRVWKQRQCAQAEVNQPEGELLFRGEYEYSFSEAEGQV